MPTFSCRLHFSWYSILSACPPCPGLFSGPLPQGIVIIVAPYCSEWSSPSLNKTMKTVLCVPQRAEGGCLGQGQSAILLLGVQDALHIRVWARGHHNAVSGACGAWSDARLQQGGAQERGLPDQVHLQLPVQDCAVLRLLPCLRPWPGGPGMHPTRPETSKCLAVQSAYLTPLQCMCDDRGHSDTHIRVERTRLSRRAWQPGYCSIFGAESHRVSNL